MSPFNAHEHILRNFSKHKFKIFIEKSILTPESHSDYQIADFAQVSKQHWETDDIAHMDMPSGVDIFGRIRSYNRWIFQLAHVEDGLIKPDRILDYARFRITELARKLGKDKHYVSDLRSRVYNEGEDSATPNELLNGAASFYFLTNADVNPFTDTEAYNQVLRAGSHEIRKAFCVPGRKGLGLSKAAFHFGLGSPSIFLHKRDKISVKVIQEVEARPDSLMLQFVNGRICVTASKKCAFFVQNKKNPNPVMIDRVIDPAQIFFHEELNEFEKLLNEKGVAEYDIQKFLEAHPKFLFQSDYDELRPQITLTDEDGCELQPDFFLKPIDKHLWDILEIKIPECSLVSGRRNREKLSAKVQEGVSQLMRYAKFFDNPRNRDSLKRQTGIDCFKPRLTLVIGMKCNLDEALWRMVISEQRPFVNIVGFDELLAAAKKRVLNI